MEIKIIIAYFKHLWFMQIWLICMIIWGYIGTFVQKTEHIFYFVAAIVIYIIFTIGTYSKFKLKYRFDIRDEPFKKIEKQ